MNCTGFAAYSPNMSTALRVRDIQAVRCLTWEKEMHLSIRNNGYYRAAECSGKEKEFLIVFQTNLFQLAAERQDRWELSQEI